MTYSYCRTIETAPTLQRIFRWSLLVGLLILLPACDSSFEFGTFATSLYSPTLIARIDCQNLSVPVQLKPEVLVSVTAGSKSSGIVQLRRVVMEYCVDPITAFHTTQSPVSSTEDACEAESNSIDATKTSRLTPCIFFTKRVCLSSLRFPSVLTCSPPKQPHERRNSRCFLDAQATLTYPWRDEQNTNQVLKNVTEIPLRSLQEPGFSARTNEEWAKICCEAASQECAADSDCQGRGTCKGLCPKTGTPCSDASPCATQPQQCLSLCDDLFQQCKENAECPKPIASQSALGTCQRRCHLTGASCQTDADCPAAPQTCQRSCDQVGTLCQQKETCARGEDCLQTCSLSHAPCQTNQDCPTGETCQKQCVPSSQLLVFTALDTDIETTYAQHASPRKMRLFCRDAQNQRISLHNSCKTPTTLTDSPATVCVGNK